MTIIIVYFRSTAGGGEEEEEEEEERKHRGAGISVDHEELAEARIRAMTAADLNRFMVTCALVPGLYCPGYSSVEALPKEANLIRAAVRHKVEALRITATVTAELSMRPHFELYPFWEQMYNQPMSPETWP